MPEAEIKKRGGAMRYRTIVPKKGRYIHVAVVRKKGPRGGRTVAGPVHHTGGGPLHLGGKTSSAPKPL